MRKMFLRFQIYFAFLTKYFILASLDPNYSMAVDNQSKQMLLNVFYVLINEFERKKNN
jgi:hypothetical protein